MGRKIVGITLLVIAGLLVFGGSSVSPVNFNVASGGTDNQWIKLGTVGAFLAAAVVVVLIGSAIAGISGWRRHFGHVFVWPSVFVLFGAATVWLAFQDARTAEVMLRSWENVPPAMHPFRMFSDVTMFAVYNCGLLVIGTLLLWWDHVDHQRRLRTWAADQM